MTTAKIIRHRHKHHHYINEDLKSVTEESFFKIVFSNPAEMETFKDWIQQHGGSYEYDKDECLQKGHQPKLDIFEDKICWCDIMSYYLMHVAGYTFYSTIHPYKGEVYVKN